MILSWGTLTFTPFFHLQVAIKIIDKTQLNPSSLQKVRPGEREQRGGKVGKRVLKTTHPPLSLFLPAVPRSSYHEGPEPPQHR